ncbi:MAG: sensor protein KdpD [Bacteroidota bacterium]
MEKTGRGKLKVYIGMCAGVGKTYKMLQEAHRLRKEGVDVQIGYIETHNRVETHALLAGIPLIPRRTIFYKGKELEEMDLQLVISLHPDVVIVDELAHTNVEGSKNTKRWQDVTDILDAGISVLSAVNIQHLESINTEIETITGIKINERFPDKVLQLADEVVNLDLTAEELIERVRAGKIYDKTKIERALNNFFQPERILQLRELALREVSQYLERRINREVPIQVKLRREKFVACISANPVSATTIIRKTARLASYYRSTWIVLYVQRSAENGDRIKLDLQRHLINNFKLAIELGAEVIKIKSDDVPGTIMRIVSEKEVTTICIGKPHLSIYQVVMRSGIFDQLLKRISETDTDLVILS